MERIIVKENEASQKKCPFRDGPCMGSRCMAWVWADSGSYHERGSCGLVMAGFLARINETIELIETRTRLRGCMKEGRW